MCSNQRTKSNMELKKLMNPLPLFHLTYQERQTLQRKTQVILIIQQMLPIDLIQLKRLDGTMMPLLSPGKLKM